MMSYLHLLSVLVLLQLPAPVPTPGDVTFTLATANGRTSFEMGEAIPLELQFRSTAPERYGFWPGSCFRPQGITFERVRVEPSDSVVDLGAPDREPRMGVRQAPSPPTPLSAPTVKTECFLNDWASFRRPGRYRIEVESYRFAPANAERGILLKSNTIEIDIVPADPVTAGARLRQAASVIERTNSPRNDEWREALDTVRFSQSPEAIPLLLRTFNQISDQAVVNALEASPHQAEILAQMEKNFEAPDFAVSGRWVFMMAKIAAALRPPVPGFSSVDLMYQRYFSRLVTLLGSKQGAARLASLTTLIGTGVVYGQLSSTEPFRKATYESFPDLHPSTQITVLTDRWTFVATPEIEPFLRSWAASDSRARDVALLRLQTVDPVEARRITLDRIRRGDILRDFSSGRPLQAWDTILNLPETTLPEMDVPLAEAYEMGKPVGDIIARYASTSAYPRIRAAFERQPPSPSKVCTVLNGIEPIVVYFYRVDVAYANNVLADARRTVNWSCPLATPLVPSPGLVQAAIRDLASADADLRARAMEILRNSPSEPAKRALWDALARARGVPDEYGKPDPEYIYAAALAVAPGWVLTPAEFDRLSALCTSKQCTDTVTRSRDALKQPILVDSRFDSLEDIRVGPFQTPFGSFERKIRQFPAGTVFRLSPNIVKGATSWSGTLWEKGMRQTLEAAGMQIER
jgi:hypothetical protein